MTDKKRICICGSMAFIDEMEYLANSLGSAGYEVDTPVREEATLDWNNLPEVQSIELKRSYIDGYMSTIKNADLVLIANYFKNGVEGYIGANSLMEAAFAYALGIPVAYLKPPGEQSCRLEALSISRLVVGDEIDTLDTLFQRLN